jgi:hypothetical protein
MPPETTLRRAAEGVGRHGRLKDPIQVQGLRKEMERVKEKGLAMLGRRGQIRKGRSEGVPLGGENAGWAGGVGAEE